ncbi:polysaccharide pyruvyl transferase family protein [Arthrobacter sp. BL-252-APC-1A]|uniref:polysaccharide pyruvyl transferase family protein n=1 Tax=Arthrobacter sp. BL-252-APC-1A TaxID=2606622 RepID=UPI0012B18CF8|nr:polysaccharide pyruvyl transferase family protein [Arthrobacter sp. BL-252-APC-1A]MSS00024.1 polysaccharide pyruvyl transferase family protein [Arthrobacter sp. BL-252-APC-1A]
MRIAVLGDVGQPVYHVGDEAMTHAAVAELRHRGIGDLLVLSRNPNESRRAFGTDSARTLAFPWPPDERSDYLARVLRAAEGDTSALPEQDQVWDLIAALRTCDALLIAGGGNMNSLYGWLLYERAAVAAVARILGLRVAIAGQTLGPDLFGADRETAGDLLSAAELAGAREEPSLHLMRDLAGGTTPVRGCLDDASFFATDCRDKSGAGRAADLFEEPFIAATFSPGHGEADHDAYLDALAEALDTVAEQTGCTVVFIPHMATPRGPLFDGMDPSLEDSGPTDADELMHQKVAARMKSSGKVLMPIQNAEQTAALTSRAALVMTSRYHPVVFALDSAVPVVAVAPEHYSHVRMHGALDNWGAGSLALTLPSLFDGSFAAATLDAWKNREAITSFLLEAGTVQRQRFSGWWDTVASALADGTRAEDPAGQPAVAFPAGMETGWQQRDAAHAGTYLPTASALSGLRVEHEHLRAALAVTERERDDARGELQAWKDSRTFAILAKIATVRALLRGKR